MFSQSLTPNTTHPAVYVRTPGADHGEELDHGLARAALRKVTSGENAFLEGTIRSHIFKVESGALALYRTLSDGRRQVLGFAFDGDLIGLGARKCHTVGAQALKPTTLRCLPVPQLKQMVSANPGLATQLYEAISEELADAQDRFFNVSQRRAIERVAFFLQKLSHRNEKHGEDPRTIVLPMSRADIGDYLGLTLETVSRTLSELRVKGIICLKESRVVHLRNLNALNELVDTPIDEDE